MGTGGGAHAGHHQVRYAAGRRGGLHVAHAVAHGMHLTEIHLVAFTNLQEQARQRLAAVAAFIGRVGAKI